MLCSLTTSSFHCRGLQRGAHIPQQFRPAGPLSRNARTGLALFIPKLSFSGFRSTCHVNLRETRLYIIYHLSPNGILFLKVNGKSSKPNSSCLDKFAVSSMWSSRLLSEKMHLLCCLWFLISMTCPLPEMKSVFVLTVSSLRVLLQLEGQGGGFILC